MNGSKNRVISHDQFLRIVHRENWCAVNRGSEYDCIDPINTTLTYTVQYLIVLSFRICRLSSKDITSFKACYNGHSHVFP